MHKPLCLWEHGIWSNLTKSMQAQHAHGTSDMNADTHTANQLAIPGINNNWLGLMKASALVSILGLEDMVWLAEQAGRATQKPFLFYFLVSLIYMVITALSSWLFSLLAKRYALRSSTAGATQ